MARVPYASQDEVPEEYRDLLVSSLQDKPVNVYSALGNNPEVLAGMRSFLGSLWSDSGLDDRQRELVILLAAAENDSAYEWHQHVRIGRGEGVTDAEMRAIVDGEFDAFDDAEARLLRYARAVVRGEVDDDLHDAVAADHDDSTLVGIAGIASGYTALARMLDAFDVDLEEDEEFFGWRPGEE